MVRDYKIITTTFLHAACMGPNHYKLKEKVSYRLFDNPKVSAEKVLAPDRSMTNALLFVQDSQRGFNSSIKRNASRLFDYTPSRRIKSCSKN